MTVLKIFTDSISDLPQTWIDQYDIGIIPVYIVFSNNKIFKDKVDISADQINRLLQEKGLVPGVSAPSQNDSTFLSSGTALMVMHAARSARKGLHINTVVKLLREFRPDVKFTILLDQLGNYRTRGYVYGLENKVKSLLKLKEDGNVRTGKISTIGNISIFDK